MIRVSVIVPARNAQATLRDTLAALAAQEDVPGGHEVIVVDNASSDATGEIAERAGVLVVEGDGSGPAHARNRGAAAAAGAVLAFTDADCAPAPGWLRAGVAAMERADLVQGRVHATPDVEAGPFDRTLWVTHEYGLYETANLFVRRSLFDELGGFSDWVDPGTGRPFAEDVLFAWRAKRGGARTVFSDDALVYHAVFPRGAREYVDEARRLRFFPALVAAVPELREVFLHKRVFMNERTAEFDLAVAGVAAAALRRSPWPLLAAVPYARRVRGDGRKRAPRVRARVAAAGVAADVVGAAALARGSIESRSLVI